jgi:hypothetical protein
LPEHIIITYIAIIESAESLRQDDYELAVASADNGPDAKDENEVGVNEPEPEPIPNEP